MTPKFTARSFSNDQFIVDTIFYNNSYKIKGQKDSGKIIIDLGAHIGSFSFTALLLGARKVYCFEPFVDNYAVLLQNVYNEHFSGRATPYQIGITPYTNQVIHLFSTPEVIDKMYFDFGNIKIISDKKQNHYPCPCLSLDSILESCCYGENVDILKINLGYSETEILAGSSLLSTQVNSICGECGLDEAELANFRKSIGIKGFINWNAGKPNESGRTQFWASRVPLSEHFNIPV